MINASRAIIQFLILVFWMTYWLPLSQAWSTLRVCRESTEQSSGLFWRNPSRTRSTLERPIYYLFRGFRSGKSHFRLFIQNRERHLNKFKLKLGHHWLLNTSSLWSIQSWRCNRLWIKASRTITPAILRSAWQGWTIIWITWIMVKRRREAVYLQVSNIFEDKLNRKLDCLSFDQWWLIS